MHQERTVYSYSVLADDGQYGAAVTVDELYRFVQDERNTNDEDERFLTRALTDRQELVLGPPPEIDTDSLSHSRWGIIWPPKPLTPDEQAHREALAPLIAHRKKQMDGRIPHEFYYQGDWKWDNFLWEEGRNIQPGNMVPGTVPYYLCIVASPDRVPWEFQQYLDSEYAVGRLWFDEPSDCERYVHHLLDYEENGAPQLSTGREALFMGPSHQDDKPTTQSATRLVRPLYEWMTSSNDLGFRTSLLLNGETGSEAYKKHLIQRLEGRDLQGRSEPRPALLFTASHGLEYGQPTEEQHANQGAPLFQEWPGPFTTPTSAHYLAADQLREDLQLTGMVAFCFACFSAGTPLMQDWVRSNWFRRPARIADAPFVARLPQKLLACGMLAFIGHVSRAWDYSFLGAQGTSNQIVTFRSTLHELLSGRRIGHAIDYLNTRWVQLTAQLDQAMTANNASKDRVIALWQARNDARGYAILGDPAAKMKIDLHE